MSLLSDTCASSTKGWVAPPNGTTTSNGGLWEPQNLLQEHCPAVLSIPDLPDWIFPQPQAAVSQNQPLVWVVSCLRFVMLPPSCRGLWGIPMFPTAPTPQPSSASTASPMPVCSRSLHEHCAQSKGQDKNRKWCFLHPWPRWEVLKKARLVNSSKKSQATRSRVRTSPSHTYGFIKYLKLLHRSKEPGYLFLQSDQSFVSLKNARPLTTHLIMSVATPRPLPEHFTVLPSRLPGRLEWLHKADSPVGPLFAFRSHFAQPHGTQLPLPQVKRNFS